MLYMVECDFSDPTLVQAWNDYYTERKLDEVLAVPGFRTSQRFKAVTPMLAPYLAIHSVDSLEVLTGSAYKGGGGGSFDARFQPCIIHWHRNLFAGLDRAPAVGLDEFLAVSDASPEAVAGAGIDFVWLEAAGLDRSVPRRGIARIDAATAQRLVASRPTTFNVFAPIMAQRVERADKPR